MCKAFWQRSVMATCLLARCLTPSSLLAKKYYFFVEYRDKGLDALNYQRFRELQRFKELKTRLQNHRTYAFTQGNEINDSEIDTSDIAHVITKDDDPKPYSYILATIASCLGLTGTAFGSIYWRCVYLSQGEDLSYPELTGITLFAMGATVAMEYWGRWVHKTLWHGCLWNMHLSHHMPRKSFFELNDVFVITNALPALVMLTYGLYNKGIAPALLFGAGIGISAYGIVNMFLHDGLIHGRFPVGPIAGLPYLKRVVAAHKLHHENRLKGVPYGIYLGPMEVEEAGGREMMEKILENGDL